MYENEGLGKLGKKTYEESIEEMKHADKLVKRILFLDGFPNLQALNKLKIGTDVPTRLECDLQAETTGRTAMVEGIALCEEKQDYATRDLLTEILDDTEEHIDFLETQISVLGQMGLQNYLQSQYELDASSSEQPSSLQARRPRVRATQRHRRKSRTNAHRSRLRERHPARSASVGAATPPWALRKSRQIGALSKIRLGGRVPDSRGRLVRGHGGR
jgi:bacterioferritin